MTWDFDYTILLLLIPWFLYAIWFILYFRKWRAEQRSMEEAIAQLLLDNGGAYDGETRITDQNEILKLIRRK